MSRFYTNVYQSGNNILVRGIENGTPFQKSYKHKPYLFVKSDKDVDSKYRTIDGKKVIRIDFDSISEARQFIRNYEDVDNMDIFGFTNFLYTFINDNYYGQLKYDPSLISVVTLDIEVDTHNGYPDIQRANNQITAITISRNGKRTVFGYKEFTPHKKNIKYYRCADEVALLTSFLEIWNSVEYSPDIITGWYTELFDVPYLVNRITHVLGSESAKLLSPWRMLKEYEVEIRGKKNQAFEPVGITNLDYMQLYKKFTYTQQESYKLDHIAFVELGEKKLDYSEYGSLDNLYQKNFQKYIEYNIHDVDLVDMLEDKLKLIELVYAIAYDAKVNYDDTLASVKPWDVIIHNFLMDRNIVVPPFKRAENRELVGGYVKDVKVGMSNWVVSFDLDSLYPHLIMQYNISPEMFVTKLKDEMSIDEILSGKMYQYGDKLREMDCAISANLCLYSRKKQGFLASLMETMYADRSKYKKQMIEVKKEYEKTKDKNLEKEISRLNNLQMAKKIQLNSAYGAVANQHFRWFDINHAEAITTSGQLSIRWIEQKINLYLNKTLNTTNLDYCIASDTDSVIITFDALVKKYFEDQTDKKRIVKFLDDVCSKKLEPVIADAYQELADYMNVYSQKMRMKREAIADKGVWTAKKRYILNVYNLEGVSYDKPKLKMMGIEAVKSSTPAVCRDAIKEALNLIMNSDENAFQNYVENFRNKFINMSFEEVAFPRGVNGINKWQSDASREYDSGTPIHVKGSIIYNNLLKKKNLQHSYQEIGDGEKIKFSYLKMPNPSHSPVISSPGELPKEFGLDQYIDYDMQFEKTFLDPVSIISNTIGWKTEKISSLESWFL
jgi:DNA polymerase elongation subunit (family B)